MKILILTFLISINAFAAPALNAASKQTVLEFGTIKSVTASEDDKPLEFKAQANPGGININGTGPAPVGTLKVTDGRVSGELVIDLSKLDSGMPMRTKHMKEKALEVEKFPNATLSFTDLKLLSGADLVPFYGKLTLHGVTKPVEGKIKFDRKEPEMKVHADFNIKLSDFAIPTQKFAGITVDDQVSIVIDTLTEMKSVAKE